RADARAGARAGTGPIRRVGSGGQLRAGGARARAARPAAGVAAATARAVQVGPRRGGNSRTRARALATDPRLGGSRDHYLVGDRSRSARALARASATGSHR